MAGVKGRSGRRPEMRTIKAYLAEALETHSKALVDKAIRIALAGDRDMLKSLLEWGAGKPASSAQITGSINLEVTAGQIHQAVIDQQQSDILLLESVAMPDGSGVLAPAPDYSDDLQDSL
ncbi:MAG: hypothetical protein WC262_08710 [Bacteroidales bacterium]|jgi:hypothetical protein